MVIESSVGSKTLFIFIANPVSMGFKNSSGELHKAHRIKP
jgi:hypothetical protein